MRALTLPVIFLGAANDSCQRSDGLSVISLGKTLYGIITKKLYSLYRIFQFLFIIIEWVLHVLTCMWHSYSSWPHVKVNISLVYRPLDSLSTSSFEWLERLHSICTCSATLGCKEGKCPAHADMEPYIHSVGVLTCSPNHHKMLVHPWRLEHKRFCQSFCSWQWAQCQVGIANQNGTVVNTRLVNVCAKQVPSLNSIVCRSPAADNFQQLLVDRFIFGLGKRLEALPRKQKYRMEKSLNGDLPM